MSQKFSYVRILTDKYAETFEFYKSALGLDLKIGDVNNNYCEFATGTTDIALYDREAMVSSTGLDLPGIDSVQSNVIIIIQVDDVDQQFEWLKEAGAPILSEPTTREEWDVRNFHTKDPEGNLVEINSRLDQL